MDPRAIEKNGEIRAVSILTFSANIHTYLCQDFATAKVSTASIPHCPKECIDVAGNSDCAIDWSAGRESSKSSLWRWNVRGFEPTMRRKLAFSVFTTIRSGDSHDPFCSGSDRRSDDFRSVNR